MFLAYLLLATVTILANLCFAVADFRRSDFVRRTSTTVGVPPSWFPVLGLLKVAGSGGLLLGLLGVPWLAAAAGAGLLAFYTGALAAHLRVRAFAGFGYTIAMWCSAAGCLALMVVLLRAGESLALC